MQIEVPCTRCGKPVMLEEDTIKHLLDFNNTLVRRGERPIQKDEAGICQDCYAIWQDERRQWAQDRERQVQEVCRKLRSKEAVSVSGWMYDGGEWERRIRAAKEAE